LHRLWAALRNIASVSVETFSRVNNYGYETKIRQEEIYFRAYRSISFFTGFVECQEQGLKKQNKQTNNTNICFANLERDLRMLTKFSD
jgi:uncharacterized protein (DUF1919 family)